MPDRRPVFTERCMRHGRHAAYFFVEERRMFEWRVMGPEWAIPELTEREKATLEGRGLPEVSVLKVVKCPDGS